jgi:hypothetical protein
VKIIILGADLAAKANASCNGKSASPQSFRSSWAACRYPMLLGRLELMTLFVLFTRTFWRA